MECDEQDKRDAGTTTTTESQLLSWLCCRLKTCAEDGVAAGHLHENMMARYEKEREEKKMYMRESLVLTKL